MTDAQPTTVDAKRPSRRNLFIGLIVAVVVLDIVAAIVVPPYPAGEPGKPINGIGDLIMANLEFPAPHVVCDLAPNEPVAQRAASSSHVEHHQHRCSRCGSSMAVILVVFVPRRPRHEGGPGQAPERHRVRLREPGELGDLARRAGRAPPRPAVRGVLPVHPVLELERPAAVLRQDRGPARADERRQRHASAWPSSPSSTSTSRASGASACAATSASSSSSAGSRRASAPGSSTCSSA